MSGRCLSKAPQPAKDHQMTTVANLLARKQQLLKRLQEDPGPQQRDEIERLLAQLDIALNLLHESRPGDSSDQ